MGERDRQSNPNRIVRAATGIVINNEAEYMKRVGDSLDGRLQQQPCSRENEWNILSDLSTLEDEMNRTDEKTKDGKRRVDEEEVWVRRQQK